MADYYANYLVHHGILGQKWGKKNGPPYPLSGGDYSKAERTAIYKKRRFSPNSIYNKKHFDEVLGTKETLSTLSYDKDRTKNTDMFYATHKSLDKHLYNAAFNRPIPKPIYDDDGNEIGTGMFLKYRIDNGVKTDLKVASEDSGANIFKNLYSSNRDFYNFVTDKNRMQSYFVDDKYKFRGYRESRKVLEKLRENPSYTPSEKEVGKLYRMFNYVIPYDGGAKDFRGAKDMATQRARFFDAAKKAGYGALLDTNDAIYGGFKATSPVIVFDVSQVIPKNVVQTTTNSKRFSSLVTAGRKAMGMVV